MDKARAASSRKLSPKADDLLEARRARERADAERAADEAQRYDALTPAIRNEVDEWALEQLLSDPFYAKQYERNPTSPLVQSILQTYRTQRVHDLKRE